MAFLTRGASPGGMGEAAWRRAEFPAANGHATAPALALLMAALANDGEIAGRRVLAPGDRGRGVAPAHRRPGPGAALPDKLDRRLHAQPGPRHLRAGASRPSATQAGVAAAPSPIPELGVSGAYVMNRQSAELIGDPRAKRLIEAAYETL